MHFKWALITLQRWATRLPIECIPNVSLLSCTSLHWGMGHPHSVASSKHATHPHCLSTAMAKSQGTCETSSHTIAVSAKRRQKSSRQPDAVFSAKNFLQLVLGDYNPQAEQQCVYMNSFIHVDTRSRMQMQCQRSWVRIPPTLPPTLITTSSMPTLPPPLCHTHLRWQVSTLYLRSGHSSPRTGKAALLSKWRHLCWVLLTGLGHQ